MGSASFSWLLASHTLLFFLCFLPEGLEGEATNVFLGKQTLKGTESPRWEGGTEAAGQRRAPVYSCIPHVLLCSCGGVQPCCGALSTVTLGMASCIAEQRRKPGEEALSILCRDILLPLRFH